MARMHEANANSGDTFNWPGTQQWLGVAAMEPAALLPHGQQQVLQQRPQQQNEYGILLSMRQQQHGPHRLCHCILHFPIRAAPPPAQPAKRHRRHPAAAALATSTSATAFAAAPTPARSEPHHAAAHAAAAVASATNAAATLVATRPTPPPPSPPPPRSATAAAAAGAATLGPPASIPPESPPPPTPMTPDAAKWCHTVVQCGSHQDIGETQCPAGMNIRSLRDCENLRRWTWCAT